MNCPTGKITYLSMFAAKNAVFLISSERSRRRNLRGRLHAYRCPVCGKFHIGR